MKEFLELISEDLQIEMDRDDFNVYRFEAHLKYLLQRIDDELMNSDNVHMFEVMIRKYPKIYECTKHVAAYLDEVTGRQINEEEMLYLMLHINRLSDKLNEQSV